MPRERIPRAARFVVKYLKSRAGGSEKKLAAKATAARKLHYTAGGSFGQSHLYSHVAVLPVAHRLLLHTVLAQSYPPFALLPLLQRGQKLSLAPIWPGASSVRRQLHKTSPCFAAKPFYPNRPEQNSSGFPIRRQKLASITTQNIVAQKASLQPHPLCKYAALGRVQHIQCVQFAPGSRSSMASLHTYARLAQPVSASNHAVASIQRPQQILQRYAQLHSKLPKHNAQIVSANVANSRDALKSYAQLSRRS